MKYKLNILFIVVLLMFGCKQSSEPSNGYISVITDSLIYKHNPNGIKIIMSVYNYTSDTLYLWQSNKKPAFWIAIQLGEEWVNNPLFSNDSIKIGVLNSYESFTDSTTLYLSEGEYQVSIMGSLIWGGGFNRYASHKFKIQ